MATLYFEWVVVYLRTYSQLSIKGKILQNYTPIYILLFIYCVILSVLEWGLGDDSSMFYMYITVWQNFLTQKLIRIIISNVKHLYITVPYYFYVDRKSYWFSTVQRISSNMRVAEAMNFHRIPLTWLRHSVIIYSSSNWMVRAPYIHHGFSLWVNRL
jgi:hypothetical protein